MATLPRPLLALLIVVLAFCAAWMTVLRPSHSSSAAPSPQVAHAYQAAVAAGHARTAGTSSAKSPDAEGLERHTPRHTDEATAAAKGHSTAEPTAKTHAKAPTAAKHGASPFSQPKTPVARAQALLGALAAHKVVALLFYNGAGADDQADLHALQAVSSDAGRVVRLAVPITEVSRYGVVTQHVPVTGSPTFIVVDARHRAQTLVGFVDQLEIDQLVATALHAR